MPRTIVTPRSDWWKYDKYEFIQEEGECWICPARSASLAAYDPWQPYAASKSKTKYDPPYQSLLELISNLELPPFEYAGESVSAPYRTIPLDRDFLRPKLYQMFREKPLSPEKRQRITKWCADWGLLGVLPQIARSVVLEAEPAEPAKAIRPGTIMLQREFLRSNGLWRELKQYVKMKDAPRPFVVVEDLVGQSPKRFEITTIIADFFSAAQAQPNSSFHLALPLSRDFWRYYREPLDRFVYFALLLQRGTTRPTTAEEEDGIDLTADRLAYLNALFSSGGSYVAIDRHQSIERRSSWPSLIAMFADMAVQDMKEGYRIINCAGCPKQFVTDRYQALYHSPQCAWKTRKRQLRSTQKLARALRAEGQTVRAIASRLDATQGQVRVWLAREGKDTDRERKRK